MRTIVIGDITTADSGIIVHCCNAQGKMGSGIAITLRNKWPQVFTVYGQAYKAAGNSLTLGDVHVAKVIHADLEENDLYVANLIGQEFYGGKPGVIYVDYDAIRVGFKTIAKMVKALPYPRMIHYPQLGAGLAGGDWDIIQAIIDEELHELDHTLWMFSK